MIAGINSVDPREIGSVTVRYAGGTPGVLFADEKPENKVFLEIIRSY